MSEQEIYEMLKREVQEEGTMSLDEAGYDSWFNFISDWGIFEEEDIDTIEKVLLEYGEDHWENLWKEGNK